MLDQYIHDLQVLTQNKIDTEQILIQPDELEQTFNDDEDTHAFIGDKLVEDAHENVFRIYIQNLHGLNWDNAGGKWPYVCDAIDAISADIACFSELNTDTNSYKIRKKMEDVCKRQFQQNALILAASAHHSATNYKPGGTAILAANSITTRIRSQTRDRMGRWASVSLETTSTSKLRIISAYQVCKNSRPGANTAMAHQTAQIIRDNAASPTISRPHPRKTFIHDLQAFIQQVQNQDEAILLAGDFNEEIGVESSGMDNLASACGLVDLFNIRIGSSTLPATYQRGRKRIDYILMSPGILPHVRAAGYDPFGYRIPSDHRGMFIDLDTESLFQNELPKLPPSDKRDFTSTSPETIRLYVEKKMNYLNDHRFFERLDALETNVHLDPESAEALDRDFHRAAVHAARMCTKKK